MFKAGVIVSLLFLASPHSLAYGLLTDAQRDMALKQVAEENVEAAKQAYLSKFHDCFIAGEKQVVSVGDLQQKGLTETEAKVALLYLSSKNYQACVSETASKYSIAVNLARYFDVAGYSLQDDPELGKSISLADALAIDEMKYRVDYLKIDQAKRTKLEQDSRLQKVFAIKR